MKKLFILSGFITFIFLFSVSGYAGKVCLEKGIDIPTAKYVMKIGFATPPSLAGFRGCYDFEEEVEARSHGLIDVKIYPSAQLGGNPQILRKAQAGIIQGAVNGAPVTANLAKSVHNILNFPFLFDTWAKVDKFVNSDLIKPVYHSLDHVGLTILGICSFESIDFLAKKPITKLSDLKGLKMRCNPGKWGVIPAKAIGIEASPVPFPSVYSQLKQGILDGIINSPDVIAVGKWEEVCRHYTPVGFYHGFLVFTVNTAWLNKLPPNLKEIVLTAGKRMCEIELLRARFRYNELLVKFKLEGVKFHKLAPGELEKMKKAWQKVEPKFAKEVGKDYVKKVYKLVSSVK
ncbi:MAG: TRAP transporter substrate-binding protein [Deltaproteobacteria bacterium]|nr:TRAP transporter substrate-binding protein [Deltaproteobacteria bacterium]